MTDQKTVLFDTHQAMGGKMVPFGGWSMPLHYGSQLEEHHRIRSDAGMFDVSHMTRLDFYGDGVRAFLRRLVANNVDKLTQPGKALYTCMLNEQGGVIDDLIIYYLREDWFRLVVNASTRDKDLDWIQGHAATAGDVQIKERTDLAMIAVQGPNARGKTYQALGPMVRQAADPLNIFAAVEVDELFIARTGYTGEDGFEIILPNDRVVDVWQALHGADVAPCGLGARDTLRLEAGMNLYGLDMDETTTPLESGLAWTVAWDPDSRDFIGRQALERQKQQGVDRKLVGLVLQDKGILRSHQSVDCAGLGAGETTSGSFSPSLNKSIALARVPSTVSIGSTCQVMVRDKPLSATVTKYPFVRNGKSCLS